MAPRFLSVGKSFAYVLPALLLVAGVTTQGHAQPLDDEDLVLAYGDKATISLATGSKQSLRRAPSVATVITAEDIAAMGATDLDEVMETLPGVHVSANNRYFSQYQIRGIGAGQTNPQVLILQNGIPMNTLYRGDKGQAWANMPLENVARIEVIRGPGSALYGADAFAGVVNIITKTAADMAGTQFGVRAGSFKSRDAWVQHGGKWGGGRCRRLCACWQYRRHAGNNFKGCPVRARCRHRYPCFPGTGAGEPPLRCRRCRA
jgi:iron complex outermembrane receptor protein